MKPSSTTRELVGLGSILTEMGHLFWTGGGEGEGKARGSLYPILIQVDYGFYSYYNKDFYPTTGSA